MYPGFLYDLMVHIKFDAILYRSRGLGVRTSFTGNFVLTVFTGANIM